MAQERSCPSWAPPTIWKSRADSYLNHPGTQPHPAPPREAASQPGKDSLEPTHHPFRPQPPGLTSPQCHFRQPTKVLLGLSFPIFTLGLMPFLQDLL